jgi:gamma-glutamylcyclotransferase (GGCT)/AIG2-like uncharacterized protein YtfP
LQDARVRAAIIGAAAAHAVGRGSVRGALYDFGKFPALVDTANGDRVPGTILLLRDAAALAKLDAYESVAEGLYVRRRTAVRLDDGGEIEAWVYVYVRSVSGRRRIAAWPF